MDAMRQSWTDDRLDDLNAKVDRIDAKVDRIDARVDSLDAKVDHLDADLQALRADTKAGFEGMYRLLIQVGGAIFAALIGLLAAVGGVAITQL
jgi:outer membrane murein-binding lipoprotein Lpp